MKHSKFLNSGIISNLAEKIIISKISKGEKKLQNETKKYVTILKSLPLVKKELDIFEQLTNTFVERKTLGSRLISEIKKDITKTNWKELNKQRQVFFNKTIKLFPEIKNSLNHYLKEYKLLASIKNFIDDSINSKLNAKDRLVIEENIIHALCEGNGAKKRINSIIESNEIPSEVDPLTVNIMIRDFCNRWKKSLTETQYKYLVDYTANGNDINNNWENDLKNKFLKFDISKIKSDDLLDKTKKIINESLKKQSYTNEDILKYAELYDTLNETINEDRIKLRKNQKFKIDNIVFSVTIENDSYILTNSENDLIISVSKKPKNYEYQNSMGMLGQTYFSPKISVGYEYKGNKSFYGKISEFELEKTIKNIINITIK